jgi:Kef-type K+ transport system membrane component KefB
LEFSLINLFLVLLVAWLFGGLATKLGYPSILGEILAGIIAGPPLLGLIQPEFGLEILANVGVFLMMLYIGMEVDHRDLYRSSWPGLLAAVGGFVVPFGTGYFAGVWFEMTTIESLFLGVAMGVTSLATKSRVLIDLGLLGTRIANVMFTSSLIADTMALLAFAGIVGIASGEGNIVNVGFVILKAALFFSVTIFLGLRIFPLVGRFMLRWGFTERTTNFTMVVLIGLVFAELAHLAGLHAILGAFLAGLFMREEILKRKLSHEVTTIIRDVSLGFLAPIFFVSVGFHVDVSLLQTDLDLLFTVVGLAIASKIAGTTIFYLASGRGWREGLTIGFGMNDRGAVEIIIAQIGLQMGLIDTTVFSALVLMAIITTSTSPVLLKWGSDWLRRRGELVSEDQSRRGVLIVGAVPLGRLLAGELQKEEPVTLIDSSKSRCQAAEMEGLRVIQGSALSEDTLDLASAGTAHTFIAMTANTEVNIAAARHARETFRIPSVFVIGTTRDEGEPGETTEGQTDGRSLLGGRFAFQRWNQLVAAQQYVMVTMMIDQAKPVSAMFKELYEIQHMLPVIVKRGERGFLPGSLAAVEPGDQVLALRAR